jgi:aspartyl-tRNA(Asn)/glutamyl-tRNA(Gln) amidotransferase subunit B
MHEGRLRFEANISVRPVGTEKLGTKVEVKNLNSIRSLERALRHEEERQRAALDRGQALAQETRHFDEERGSTHTLRSKEEAFDYRYFPEPDLPPLEPDRAWVEGIRTALPELPAARRERYRSALGLKPEQARILAGSRVTAAFFEETLSLGAEPTAVANWITQDIAGLANAAKVDLADAKVTPVHVADLVGLVADGTISVTGAKQVLEDAFETGEPAASIVERRGLHQVTDASALQAWVDEAIAENPGPVEQYRSGKEGALNAVLGAVMKRSGGSADPKAVRELLLRRLSGS